MFRLLVILLVGLAFSSCQQTDQTPAAEYQVFTNGTIYTGNETAPTAEAVVIQGNHIVMVGSKHDAEQYLNGHAKIIDLNGAFMYPGFTDSHMHLKSVGERELTLNLEGTPSIADLVGKIADAVASAEAGQIIVGSGWIETHWPENRFPTAADLDAVSPENPVLLGRADGHAAVANSKMLELANITRETEAPFGGDILKDENGEPTGMLIDAAVGLAAEAAFSEVPTREETERFYEIGASVYNAYGWTGVHYMSVDPADVAIMENLSKSGRITLRIYNALRGNDPDTFTLLEDGPLVSEDGLITTRAVKLYLDGALGSRGALLLAPYSDAPDTSGLLQAEKEDILKILVPALRDGIQISTHAIGDAANRLLLDWYEEAFAAVPEEDRAVANPRWRDEHTQIVHPDDIPRFAKLGVIPSMQPSHAIGDLHFAPDRLGQDRLVGAYPWQSLLDTGTIIVAGSDAPVERGDPRIEFYAAIARKDLSGYSGEGWHPEQAVSREDALKMFTIWPAYASFRENELGTIQVGKLADFTVFSADIMTIPEPEILKVDIVMTVVDGKIAYSRDDF